MEVIVAGRIDAETKEYVKRPQVFADLFNYLICGGKGKFIDAENLVEMDTTELFIPYDDKGVAYPTQKFRDVLKSAVVMEDSKAAYALILGAENQTDIHYAMPVKNMTYDAYNYASQAMVIARKHRKEKDTATKAEFLSGMHKDDKLLPVITLVVYFGQEEWDGPMSLHEMLITKDPILTKFVPDYRINLIAPVSMDMGEIEKFTTDFKDLAAFIKCSKNKDAMKRLVEANDNFRHMDPLTANIANDVTKSGLKLSVTEKGDVNMCVAIAGIKADGIAEGEVRRENVIVNLFNKLLAAGRNDDALKASTDAEYRKELIKEFGLK